MTPIIALAGLAGFSTEDQLFFDGMILAIILARDLFLPIVTFHDPPPWMVLLQPAVVIGGLISLHFWLRRRRLRALKRVSVYVGLYCVLTFTTNMAGEGKAVFSVAHHVVQEVKLLLKGQGWPRDTRP